MREMMWVRSIAPKCTAAENEERDRNGHGAMHLCVVAVGPVEIYGAVKGSVRCRALFAKPDAAPI